MNDDRICTLNEKSAYDTVLGSVFMDPGTDPGEAFVIIKILVEAGTVEIVNVRDTVLVFLWNHHRSVFCQIAAFGMSCKDDRAGGLLTLPHQIGKSISL